MLPLCESLMTANIGCCVSSLIWGHIDAFLDVFQGG